MHRSMEFILSAVLRKAIVVLAVSLTHRVGNSEHLSGFCWFLQRDPLTCSLYPTYFIFSSTFALLYLELHCFNWHTHFEYLKPLGKLWVFTKHFEKFKVGLPVDAVKLKMKLAKVDDSMLDKWADELILLQDPQPIDAITVAKAALTREESAGLHLHLHHHQQPAQ